MIMYAFWLFKVIQGHWPLHKSKAHVWLQSVISYKLYLSLFPRYSAVRSKVNHRTIVWAPDQADPFEVTRQTYHAHSWGIELSFYENRTSRFVTILRVTNDDMTHYDNSRALQWNCNVRPKLNTFNIT